MPRALFFKMILVFIPISRDNFIMPRLQKAKKRTQKSAKFSAHRSSHIISFFIMALFLGVTFALVFLLKQTQDPRTSAAVNLVNCTVTQANEAIDGEEQAFLGLLNAYRQQNGVGTVKFSPNLNRAAAWMSQDMMAKNYFDHTDSFSRLPFQRIKDCGYEGSGTGENIATGNATAQSVLNSWKASPAHNELMLNSTYQVIGIARSGELWTLDLGNTDDTNVIPTSGPTPTQTVPSPVCGGSMSNACPTEPITPPVPTTVIPTAITPTAQPTLMLPTDVPSPTPTLQPTSAEMPTPTTAQNTPTVTPPGGGAQQPVNGFFNLILQFLLAILALFASLLGR